jgi:hypothetical protein
MTLYQEMIENWFYIRGQDLNYYKNMIKALESADIETFVAHIQTYINSTISFLDFTKTSTEGVFHGFMAGFLGGMRDSYDITSNRESGLGRYDLMLAPKKPGKRGIILEFKVAKTQKSMKNVASQGLAQILEKGYADRFLHSTEILIIGMAFWKKNVVADYKIVEKTS